MSRRRRRAHAAFYALIVGLLAIGCGHDGPTDPPSDPGPTVPLAGGAATVFNATSSAYTLPAPNLAAGSLDRHFAGDAAFEAAYVTAPAVVQSGLGPAFNETSCAGCHVRNGRGRESMLFRISAPGRDAVSGGPMPLPGFGGQLQQRAVFGAAPEARIEVDWLYIDRLYDDGSPYSMRWPTYRAQGITRPIPSSRLLSPRVGPPVFGLGLIEAISEETLLELAARPDTSGDGVSGRVNYVWDVERQERVIGRFGWKASEPDLVQQSAHAFQEDMGVTSPIFPRESTADQPEYDDSLPDDPEISRETVELAAFYLQTLGVPARRKVDDPQVRAGEQLFAQAGCVACHVARIVTGAHPTVSEMSHQVIHPYSDFLLHDMGAALDDGRNDFDANPSEWRTPPLWGVGLLETVNGHVELMHDGRARGFLEAIVWHGGEAEAAKQRVLGMSQSERLALVAFLRSL